MSTSQQGYYAKAYKQSITTQYLEMASFVGNESSEVSRSSLRSFKVPSLSQINFILSTSTVSMESIANSPLLALPLELRLQIYNLALGPSSPVHIGTYAPAAAHLHPRHVLPALMYVSSHVRSEALQVYFGTTPFIFHLQSHRGVNRILNWIRHSEISCGWAFDSIRYVTFVVGSGLVERPVAVGLDLTVGEVSGVRVERPAAQVGPLQDQVVEKLRTALEQLGDGRRGKFGLRKWLEGAVRMFGGMLDDDKDDRVGERAVC